MIAANPSSSSDVRLIKANYAAPSIYVSAYNFESTLSGSTSNLVNSAYFRKGSTKAYLVGKTRSFNGNLLKSFAADVGFIMEVDYLSAGAQSQCLILTLAYSSAI